MTFTGSMTISSIIGMTLGALVAWLWLARHYRRRHHRDRVRWTRRIADAESERNAEQLRLKKAFEHANERQETLHRALSETEETLALLSDEKLPAFERELRGRNERIIELEHELAVSRARLADAADELATHAAGAAAELQQREQRIEKLSEQVAELDSLRRSVQTHERALARREEQIEQKTAALKAAETERSARDAAYRQLEQQMSELASRTRHELTISRERLDQRAALIEAAKQEADELRSLVTDRDSELTARHTRLEQLTSQLTDLQHQLRERDQRHTGLTQQKRELDARIERMRAEAVQRDRRIEELSHEVAKREHQTEALKAEHLSQQQELRVELEALRRQLPELQQSVHAHKATIGELRARIREYEKRLPDYESELSRRDAQIATLDREFTALRRKLPALNDALRERESSIEDLVAELARQRRRFASLQQRLGKSREPNVSTSTRAKVIDLKRHLDEAPRSSGRSSAEHGRKRARKAGRTVCLDAPRDERDDLKRIRGIGPVIERRLNELGIFHFDQLAGLAETDIEWVASRIKMPGRIERDGWIEQARKLSDHTSGGQRSGA